MCHNGTRVKALEIRASGIKGDSGTARHRALPVPVASSNVEDVAPIEGAGGPGSGRQRGKLLHHRPLAAFLTQLALQYDDISVSRRARQRRRRAAANGYAAPSIKRNWQTLGVVTNIKT